MGTLLLYGSSIMSGVRTSLGTAVQGVRIRAMVESEPFTYFTEANAPSVPAIILEPEDWPALDYDAGGPKHVLHAYRGNVYFVDDIPNLSTQSVYARVRDRTTILAQRLANTQTLGLANPLANPDSEGIAPFVTYVRVGRVDLRSPEHRELQRAGQKRVVGKFSFEVEMLGPKPKSRTNVTTE